MWRFVLGGFLSLAFLVFAVWSSLSTLASVHAQTTPATHLSTIDSFQTKPGLPDPNAVYDQVNAVRVQHGLQPLARSDTLATIAGKRAADMSAFDYYAHRSPSGLYFYDMFGENHYLAGFACENLDLEFSKLTDQYVNDWLASTKGHKECMLSPKVTEAGYATAEIKTSTATNPDVPSYLVVAIYAEAPASN
jgi:uncharacterized protein YkwD